MKRAIILSLILFSMAQGASEIQSFTNCTAAFAVVRELDGDVWYVTGQVFEAWGTSARTATHYNIALTAESGGMFTGTFDTNIGAGYYHIVTHDDADSTPADTDPAVWAEYGYWDGDEWLKGATAQDVNNLTMNPADVNDAVWSALVTDFTDELTFGGEVGGLDPNITLILEDTGTTIPATLALIKYKTDLITILDTTVKDANDANNFTLNGGIDVNDALWFHIIMVTDADDSHSELRLIEDYYYDGTDPNILVNTPFGFTPAVGDVVHVMGTYYDGLTYEMWNWLRQGSVPNYYIDATKTGGAGVQGGVTRFDPTGDDP